MYLTSIGSVVWGESINLLGDSEIRDLDRFIDRNQEIPGLYIFMNHILTVEILCKKDVRLWVDGLRCGRTERNRQRHMPPIIITLFPTSENNEWACG